MSNCGSWIAAGIGLVKMALMLFAIATFFVAHLFYFLHLGLWEV